MATALIPNVTSSSSHSPTTDTSQPNNHNDPNRPLVLGHRAIRPSSSLRARSCQWSDAFGGSSILSSDLSQKTGNPFPSRDRATPYFPMTARDGMERTTDSRDETQLPFGGADVEGLIFPPELQEKSICAPTAVAPDITSSNILSTETALETIQTRLPLTISETPTPLSLTVVRELYIAAAAERISAQNSNPGFVRVLVERALGLGYNQWPNFARLTLELTSAMARTTPPTVFPSVDAAVASLADRMPNTQQFSKHLFSSPYAQLLSADAFCAAYAKAWQEQASSTIASTARQLGVNVTTLTQLLKKESEVSGDKFGHTPCQNTSPSTFIPEFPVALGLYYLTITHSALLSVRDKLGDFSSLNTQFSHPRGYSIGRLPPRSGETLPFPFPSPVPAPLFSSPINEIECLIQRYGSAQNAFCEAMGSFFVNGTTTAGIAVDGTTYLTPQNLLCDTTASPVTYEQFAEGYFFGLSKHVSILREFTLISRLSSNVAKKYTPRPIGVAGAGA